MSHFRNHLQYVDFLFVCVGRFLFVCLFAFFSSQELLSGKRQNRSIHPHSLIVSLGAANHLAIRELRKQNYKERFDASTIGNNYKLTVTSCEVFLLVVEYKRVLGHDILVQQIVTTCNASILQQHVGLSPSSFSSDESVLLLMCLRKLQDVAQGHRLQHSHDL